jgi:hypothetical protein
VPRDILEDLVRYLSQGGEKIFPVARSDGFASPIAKASEDRATSLEPPKNPQCIKEDTPPPSLTLWRDPYEIGPTKCGKGTNIAAIADNSSHPISLSIASASPHQSTLVEGAIRNRYTKNFPCRIIEDKAYDCDPLDEKLANDIESGLSLP